MKFPSLAHWKQFFKILSPKERAAFFVCVIMAVGGGGVLTAALHQKYTLAVPADSGSYTEGVIGRPRFLNPVYAASHGPDQDIVELLFSGLLEYDSAGRIVPGLADYNVSEDGKIYEFRLKEGAKWSDGREITSDDAIYTVKIIQDQAYKSPLRPQWIGVETEKVSETVFRFKLQNPYSSFPENCTLKIIPRHIWENTTADNFSLSPNNLNPVGSGRYKFKRIVSDKSNVITAVELERNPLFSGPAPFLRQVNFAFFNDYEALAAAFKQGRIQGYAARESNGTVPAGATAYNYSIPRYFAVFFNPKKNEALADPAVRNALARAAGKDEIIRAALAGRGAAVDSPIAGVNPPPAAPKYDPEEAARLLDEAGYARGEDGVRVKTTSKKPAFQFTKTLVKGSSATAEIQELQKCLAREVMPELEATGSFGDQTLKAVNLFQEKYRQDILDPQGLKDPTGDVKLGTREKLNQVCFPSGDSAAKLEITIAVAAQEPFAAAAGIIKKQWESIGVAVNIREIPAADIERDAVKPRDYEALLFGQALGMIADPYPFWHSTQIADPGLNFAIYENKDADKLLEEIRAAGDIAARAEKLAALQDLIIKDSPAVFLYNPEYRHIAAQSVKGMKSGPIADPSRRFAGIAEWYTATKRIFNPGN